MITLDSGLVNAAMYAALALVLRALAMLISAISKAMEERARAQRLSAEAQRNDSRAKLIEVEIADKSADNTVKQLSFAEDSLAALREQAQTQRERAERAEERAMQLAKEYADYRAKGQ